jgi:hypothetical protein
MRVDCPAQDTLPKGTEGDLLCQKGGADRRPAVSDWLGGAPASVKK